MLRVSGMDKKYNELDVAQFYLEFVGPYIAKKTREVKVKDRTLVLYLDSGTLKEELSIQKTRIIAAINERFGKVVIEDVQIW